jgi:starch synthase
MARLSVLAVASEVFPLVKTGGLADVVGALPAALAREDVATRTLVPGYPQVLAALPNAEPIHAFASLCGAPARLLAARHGTLDLLVLDAPQHYGRPGNPYLGPDGHDWPDNALRFAALAQCAAAIARGGLRGIGGAPPDVVHAHDWQAGLAPALLHYAEGPRPPTVMTVHNLSFQGLFPRELLAAIGLPAHAWSLDGVEYHGAIGYLKAGLALADRITTVSPTYAAEIRTPEEGMGMDGLLRQRAAVLSGIRNGIDDDVWNPATDPLLPSRYDAKHLSRRAANKRALQGKLGLAVEPAAPLFGVVSRLTPQKGYDVLARCLDRLLSWNLQLVLLGSGDREAEHFFATVSARHPDRLKAWIGFDNGLAHRIVAGSDFFLMPSRFEPCGLSQLYSLRYGTLPVVRSTGGLVDTVRNYVEATGEGTGFHFQDLTPDALANTVGWALSTYFDRPGHLQAMRLRAMAEDFSWDTAAEAYERLYLDAYRRRRGHDLARG